MKENMAPPLDGDFNEVTNQMSERKPLKAGEINDVKSQNNMRDTHPTTGGDKRMTGYHNMSCDNAAKSSNSCLSKSVLGML